MVLSMCIFHNVWLLLSAVAPSGFSYHPIPIKWWKYPVVTWQKEQSNRKPVIHLYDSSFSTFLLSTSTQLQQSWICSRLPADRRQWRYYYLLDISSLIKRQALRRHGRLLALLIIFTLGCNNPNETDNVDFFCWQWTRNCSCDQLNFITSIPICRYYCTVVIGRYRMRKCYLAAPPPNFTNLRNRKKYFSIVCRSRTLVVSTL